MVFDIIVDAFLMLFSLHCNLTLFLSSFKREFILTISLSDGRSSLEICKFLTLSRHLIVLFAPFHATLEQQLITRLKQISTNSYYTRRDASLRVTAIVSDWMVCLGLLFWSFRRSMKEPSSQFFLP